MFLKSLDIFGFKSFADRTHIDFADGITALLGPNGCGKSNVVDAMKWVLAENRSKNLRAEKMEDVIFNGTETRPALNIAEVTLTISNENSLLQVPESEIAIKRRLFRSGESSFYINNRQVGPTEIRKLFMDTGVGKAAYSVMEQGKIDQILSSKPEDRRYLFEEAAGISRSKAQCVEAEREIEKTKQDLQQIEVALAEIKRSYDSLKIQSEKTIKYRSVKDEVFDLQLDIQLLKLKGFVETKARNEKTIGEVAKKRDEVHKEIEVIVQSLSENNDKIKEMQDRVYALQADLISLGQAKNGKLELQKEYNSTVAGINEKISLYEVQKKTIESNIEDYNEELGEAESSLHKKKKQLDEIKENIDSFIKNIETASVQINENDMAVSQKQTQIEELAKKRDDLQNQLTEITEDIVTELDSKLKDAGYSANAMNQAKQTLDETISRLKIFLDGRKNIFSDFVSTGCRSSDDGAKMGKDAVNAFTEALSLIDTLQAALTDYIKSSPQFIGEFLSPEGIITQKRTIDEQIEENIGKADEINRQIESLRTDNSNLVGKIEEYKSTLSNLKINEGRMQEQIESENRAMADIRRNITREQQNLDEKNEQIFGETKAKKELEEKIESVQEELAEIERKGNETSAKCTELDNAIKEANKHNSGKESERQKKVELEQKYQAQFEQLNDSLKQIDTEIKYVKQNFLEMYSRDLMEYEERMYTITTPAAELKSRLSTQKEEMEKLSRGLNYMAPEEFTEVKERYERQQSNYDDTKKTLADLERVNAEIKAKSSEMFQDTYNKIKRNFHNMFRRLFNGGKAELRLEHPEDILTTGIEIWAQPPGKKMENIALLSGGEKTMTAIALLFATYQVRPSPFCLLDEIDAALDDKNVSSFVTALRAFANVSQYIVITHNKKTVMGASTMLGVTMQESGVSKIIALRLDDDIDKIRKDVADNTEEFVEEDVPPEEGIVIPPRPPRRSKDTQGLMPADQPKAEEPKPEENKVEEQAPADSNASTKENKNDEEAGN